MDGYSSAGSRFVSHIVRNMQSQDIIRRRNNTARYNYPPSTFSNLHKGYQTDGQNYYYSRRSVGYGGNSTTIHNEKNGIVVSSDDSSDDDDVIDEIKSLSSQYSVTSTIHNEANGIWVSSDEESECDETENEYDKTYRLPKETFFSDGESISSPHRYSRNCTTNRLSNNTQISEHSLSGYGSDAYTERYSRNMSDTPSEWGNNYQNHRYDIDNNLAGKCRFSNYSMNDWSRNTSGLYSPSHRSCSSSSCSTGIMTDGDGASSNSSCTGSPISRGLRRRRTLSARTSKSHISTVYSNKNTEIYKQFEVDRVNKNLSANQEDSDQEMEHQDYPAVLRRYKSLDTTLQSSGDSGYNSTARLNYPYQNGTNSYNITHEKQNGDAASTFKHQNINIQSKTNDEYIKLYVDEFWDPYGKKAKQSERVIFGTGIALCFFNLYSGMWITAVFLMVITCISATWFSTKYRILNWRSKSGIEVSETFNKLYHKAENVCVDTCIQKPNGEMKPRQVCAGEVAIALKTCNADKLVLKSILLRFWVEACAHFRLTLRAGCQHLGEGQIKPYRLTTASLIRRNPGRLPDTMCMNCRNKTEIEAKFPLRFN